MQTTRCVTLSLLAGAWLAASGSASASCGSAFCALNTDWAEQGLAGGPGWRLDLRYEFIDQDQPRAGHTKVAVGQVPRDHDEVRTLNRNLNFTVSHDLNEQWGFTVSLPVVSRDHRHVDAVDGPEQWKFTRVGDARVLARYRLPVEAFASGRSGFQFGLKLPTGKTDATNDEGVMAERTLQPGSGTTDLLLGGFHSGQSTDGRSGWFAQATLQLPTGSHDDFKPGRQLLVDVGGRRHFGERLNGMLQLNAQIKSRDSGAQAEPEDSGGRYLFLSPGVSYAVNNATLVYAFVQQPLHQSVNGVQLTAHRALALGVSLGF